MENKTTIEITDNTWEILNRLKKRGETFEQVISRIIKENRLKKVEKYK